MSKRIIYSQPDGTVAIVIPSPQYIQELMEAGNTNIVTYEQAVEFIAKKDAPAGYEIVDISDIPSDCTFRNAWEKVGRGVVHNINKCKELTHEKRRNKRSEEFAPLDVEATIPSKAPQAEVKREAIRQKYATIQTNIDNANTVEELHSIFHSM